MDVCLDDTNSSEANYGSTGRGASHSDKEVVMMLATSTPKKPAGRRVFKETRHPIFRGVRRRNNNKWVCELREPQKQMRIWLGTYPTPEMAARAHDVAALAFRGKSACLNFADSAWRLPVPASNDAFDIRKAAAEAAELFRQHDDENRVVMSPEDHKGDDNDNDKNNGFYMDEEAVFDMPRLLVNMAEGLLLSPPPLIFGDDGDYDRLMKWDHDHDHDEGSCVSLWSHSF